MSSTTGKPQRSKWFALVWAVPLALVLLAAVVLLAQWLRTLPGVQEFMTTYPGHTELPENTPVGFPAWLGWSHFFNALLILLIIRSGWRVRTVTKPPAKWTRNNKGFLRTKGAPKTIGLDLWFHLSLDALWVLNGIIFYILLFSTGQWARIIPTSWDIFPNAVSTAIQYASLNWPLENGWVNYNALQVLAYFVTVFIAAPLAIITGLRMSAVWPREAKINKLYPVELARAIHFPVMLYFVLFIIAHVTLVFATGVLRNLNHMYAMRDDETWWGFGIFAVSLVVMIGAWIAANPVILRSVAGLTGKISR